MGMVLLLAMLLNACSSSPVRNTNSYVVKPGDTLYSIAWRHRLDYHELARVNHVGRDYRIHVGQILNFLSHTNAVTPPPKSSAIHAPSTPRPIVSNLHWQWPVSSAHYTATTRPNGGRGLTINGVSGQNIVAAAAGRVVYAGTGLLGYGQLLILKHDETYLSAYGHTQTLIVHEGDQVAAGQKIATVGNGPSGVPQLYFEIRANGEPLQPLSLLPQQR